QEKWVLRHVAKQPPIRADADALYDSATVAHDIRWDLRLPIREQTLSYMKEVRDRVLERLEGRGLTIAGRYFIQLAVFHEDMHTEAFTYTRQTLGYPPPKMRVGERETTSGGSAVGDVHIPGGTFQLGATPEEPFIFDNEKWAHAVDVRPFGIARTAVTQ